MEEQIIEQEFSTDQEYYSLDRMSNSALSNFKKSPRHYLYFKEHSKEATPAMIFGNAFHTFILENDKFEERYCCVPPDAPDRPTNAMINAKKPSESSIIRVNWWAEFNQKNGGKICLTTDDTEKLKRMADALWKHEPAMDLINEIGEVEKPLLWKDDVSGIEMKGKLDGVHSDFTIDLKTCMNAQPDSFSIDAFNNAYHRQAALYMDGRAENKMNKGDFYFIAIEKEQPHGVSVLKCAKDFIQHGRMVYGGLLEDVRYWVEMGRPDVGYEWRSPFGYHDLNLPAWVK